MSDGEIVITVVIGILAILAFFVGGWQIGLMVGGLALVSMVINWRIDR